MQSPLNLQAAEPHNSTTKPHYLHIHTTTTTKATTTLHKPHYHHIHTTTTTKATTTLHKPPYHHIHTTTTTITTTTTLQKPHYHHNYTTTATATATLQKPPYHSYKTILTSNKRLFYTRMRLGHFDPPHLNPYSSINSSVVQSPLHREAAIDTATKSFVLLKNQGVLPMKIEGYKHIAVGEYGLIQNLKNLDNKN